MRHHAEQLLEWANPNKETFYGQAFSEDHAAEIASEVARRRQQFLLDAVHSRQGVIPEASRGLDTELDFRTIPLRSVLDRDDHLALATRAWGNKYGICYGPNELKSYWTKLAEIQARLDGHPLFTTKNSDFYLSTGKQNAFWRKENEKRFQMAVDDSAFIQDSGYPIRFLMTGVQYVRNAVLDMDSVATWLENREKGDYPTVYLTPQGFWPAMVEAKQAEDETAGERSYDEVVTSPLPGVFIAPYIDDHIDRSPDYFHFDDIFHEAALEGFQEQIATRALRTVVKLLCDKQTDFEELRYAYFGPVTSADTRPGVLFFHVDVLSKVLDCAEDIGATGKSLQLLENLEAKCGLKSDEFDALVFD